MKKHINPTIMSRHSRFRAIDLYSDDFIFGQAIILDPDNNQGYMMWGISNHHCVKFETKGEFTGFTDVHSKPIFEGDICERNGHYYIISFTKGMFFVSKTTDKVLHLKSMFTHDGYALHNYARDMNVIGNIHQHPKLVEKLFPSIKFETPPKG